MDSSLKELAQPSLQCILARTLPCLFDHLARALGYNRNSVQRQIRKAFHQPAGPADLEIFDLIHRLQAEVNAHIVVGNIAGAASDLIDLLARSRLQHETSPDTAAVRACADGFDLDPMIWVRYAIDQQAGSLVAVGDHG